MTPVGGQPQEGEGDRFWVFDREGVEGTVGGEDEAAYARNRRVELVYTAE